MAVAFYIACAKAVRDDILLSIWNVVCCINATNAKIFLFQNRDLAWRKILLFTYRGSITNSIKALNDDLSLTLTVHQVAET